MSRESKDESHPANTNERHPNHATFTFPWGGGTPLADFARLTLDLRSLREEDGLRYTTGAPFCNISHPTD